MIRKLLIVSAAGAALSVACITAATALVSHDLGDHGWNWTFTRSGDHIRFVKGTPGPVPAEASKSLAWTGGDLLSVATDADVEYVPGDTPSVTVTGSKDDIDRIRLDGGRIFSVGEPDHDHTVTVHFGDGGVDADRHSGGVKVVVTAPGVKRFEVSGSGGLTVRSYDQATLDLALTGSGDAELNGHTDAVKLNVSGSGDADLSALQTRDADITVSGSGGSEIAATGKATIDISGSGNVELKTKPESVSSHVSGSGSLDQD